ncbi:MAG: pilus assembly protein PilM [Pseudomonadota bacterium]
MLFSDLINRLTVKRNQELTLGISIESHALAISLVKHIQGNAPYHQFSTYRAIKTMDEMRYVLKRLVREYRLRGCSAHLVLPTHWYRVFQVVKPTTLDENLPVVLIKSVRQFIDFPLTRALLDYYELPPQYVKNCRGKINVVCSNLENVEPITQWIQQAGLRLKVIDIPELACKNLMAFFSSISMKEATGWMYHNENRVIFAVYAQNQLLLVRTLSHIRNLQEVTDKISGEKTKKQLLHELRKTLNDCRNQLINIKIGAIYLQPLIVDVSELCEFLTENLSIAVRSIDINTFFNNVEPLSAPTQYSCVKSLAIACRQYG